ncbi:hypothetical protein ACSV9I_14120 [Rhizobium sp. G187]|uniref:hypothetical protein n=1 Tax=Rhizobium sp. G187 TaxID=3451352 RepID=UPI003EE54EBD
MDWQTFSAQWGFNYAFWVATAVAIISIFITFWIRSRSRLAFDCRSSTIVGQNKTAFSKMIKISFDGKEIPRGTVSTFTIWNDGNKTIRRVDIARKKPLMFKVAEGQQILQASIYSAANEAMDVSVDVCSDSAADVLFEFIEPKQGFICDVFHTGTASDITFEGMLIEAGEPRRREMPAKKDRLDNIFGGVAVCLFFPSLGYMYFLTLDWSTVGPVFFVILGSLGFLYLFMLAVTVSNLISHFNSSQLRLGSPD